MPIAPWVSVEDLPADRPDLPGGDAEWAALAELATHVLFTLSGRRWAGAMPRTVEIVAVNGSRWGALSSGNDWWWDGSWGAHTPCPGLVGGEVVNHTCCSQPAEVRLPHAPVTAVTEVRIGEAIRDPGSYRLFDDRWLQDTSGLGWDTCTGLTVTYLAGRNPPESARDLAAQLALQYGYGRVSDPRCRLPSNVTSITRQGVTQSFTPAAALIAAGRTGLDEVDRWLALTNPTNRAHRPSSWSPDTHLRTAARAPEESP